MREHPRCVVYVPRELVTGADFDLILMGEAIKGTHFRVQSKKLKRNDTYADLNRKNKNKHYQANLLCAAPLFYPLYLFYNCYKDIQSSGDRKRLSFEGCTIASGWRIKRAINPGRKGKRVLKLDALITLQEPWWRLVCPRKRAGASLTAIARAAVHRLETRGDSSDDPEDSGPKIEDAYRELDGPHRALNSSSIRQLAK